MEFWGIEVKSGEPFKVSPGDGMVLHLSQASIGETKHDKDLCIHLFVNVDGKKLVLGTLFSQKLPQQQFDLVFERDFELSHNFKGGSVYFFGYKAANPVEDDEFPAGDSDESDSDEENLLNIENNGRLQAMAKQDKPAEVKLANSAKGKEPDTGKKVKIVEPSKESTNQEDDESSDDAMSEDEGDSEDSDGLGNSDDDDDDESDDEDDEETPPKKVESSKKRVIESASKTPVPNKKTKENPQGTDGKKVGGHVSTPYPSKQTAKALAKSTNEKTPKSAGAHECKSCARTFGSEQALDSHNKAKHGPSK